MLPAYLGYTVGIYAAGDPMELRNIMRNKSVFKKEMEDYKLELYYS